MRNFLLFVLVFCGCGLGVYAQGGKVDETAVLHSKILNMDRNYSVYLPPGYETSNIRYPVLYLLHGSGDDHTGWIQFGQVQRIADNAILNEGVAPMIIVMPDANTGVRGYFNEIHGKFNYEDFFFQELIPHIEKTYRCRTDRQFRAVAGLSMGGGGAVFYALHRPEMFATAGPMSAYLRPLTYEELVAKPSGELIPDVTGLDEDTVHRYFRDHSVEEFLKNVPADRLDKIRQIRWYVTCGDDDYLYEDNSRLHVLFRKENIPHEYRVKDGGHSWGYWRDALAEILKFTSQTFTR